MILAVYGTLRRGGPANHLLRGASYLGKDKIPGKLYNLGSFPGYRAEGDGSVVVDLYKLPERFADMLGAIDRYEGCYPSTPDQSLYNRRSVTTLSGKLSVVTYAYKFPSTNEIPSGDWFDVT